MAHERTGPVIKGQIKSRLISLKYLYLPFTQMGPQCTHFETGVVLAVFTSAGLFNFQEALTTYSVKRNGLQCFY